MRCSAHTISPPATLSPSLHFPVSPVIGLTAPEISRRDEEGFSSCLTCPCHRAVANTPPKWFAASVSLRRSMLPSPTATGSAFGVTFFEATLRLLSLRPDDSLTILKMALSIDSRD